MPFLVASDGRYASDINAWLRSLPMNGVRSRDSWRAYARDVRDWASFLEADEIDIWDASEDDLERYHRSRRLGDDPVKPGTWVRGTYALCRLYRWGLGRGLIRAMPFSETGIREKGSGTESIRFVSKEDYVAWRNVGLRGVYGLHECEGTPRVRNSERNSSFADLLVTTGLRLREGSYPLLSEMPVRSQNPLVHQERWHVPPGLAKGKRARHTLAPVRVLRALEDYIAFERTVVVDAAFKVGAYKGTQWIRLCRVSGNTGWLSDGTGRVNLRDAGPEKRRRFLLCDGDTVQPLMIFLTEEGMPMSARSWESIFARATRRCSLQGYDVRISPHVLRHTFATWTLTRYLRQHMKANADGAGTYKAYLLAPVRRLMRLMGHKSSHTTFKYLDLVGDVPELLDEALEDFGLVLPDEFTDTRDGLEQATA